MPVIARIGSVWCRLVQTIFVLGLLGSGFALAQSDEPTLASPTTLRSPVLILDYDRLFAQSQFGQRVLREIEASGRRLIAENNRIEAELTEEERALATQRQSLSPEEFRELADAFDAKVQQLRDEQQIKAQAVGEGRDVEERRFRQLATPIIGRLMQDAGAVVVLDRQDTIIWVEAVDITDDVLRIADRVIGQGTAPRTPALSLGEDLVTPQPPVLEGSEAPANGLLQDPTTALDGGGLLTPPDEGRDGAFDAPSPEP